MNKQEKLKLLRKLLEKSSIVKIESSSDPDFKHWKNLVERTFIKVFGKNSTEFEHFNDLTFYYQAFIYTSTSDYTSDHLRCFRRDYKMLIDSINEYIEELEEEKEVVVVKQQLKVDQAINKIFISHASKDADVVEEIIELLEAIGVESNQIFCTSFEGYGIDLGENFLDAIKTELSSDSMVLFLLSEHFYKSPVCMCEMGAAWVLSKEHIPIVVPPLTYSDIQGVLPLTQGMLLTDSLKLNSFKEKIEKTFNITNGLSFSTWERKRDRVCSRLEKILG
ncbi:toll/interleukin-1 receptor domain-containing protein [Vibrio parahaemolyticus]|uniref:toll/interleukin-1 receptor domain-containing protein n=1 Tax=Vibrio parahaemolyticus TaxID=670 RepID=UPI00038E50F3|nr:toll/interleukin-1 receptor domain-containing protein [Vibrio parahaemolyticus]EJG0922095.1 toll/interleukin-1 receptor domain-containing protein [Vibrio parahaemolyticus O1:K68]EJG0931641.1 toll/interleukin-1 receptor domain-containing protein [Vibrio parahaemolyticus O1]EJG0945948.1 toll/interleukin-1 receptor domain-containing protein [Vibrio parahaemolyticus O10]EQM49704.1 TIR domain protein [Vibrio parahaemolyticus VPCR-2010]EGQ9063826.1 TIR domain-containing protein [Vibrio parahaemol